MRAFLVLVFLIVGIICYVQIYILAKTKKKIITVKKAAQFESMYAMIAILMVGLLMSVVAPTMGLRLGVMGVAMLIVGVVCLCGISLDTNCMLNRIKRHLLKCGYTCKFEDGDMYVMCDDDKFMVKLQQSGRRLYRMHVIYGFDANELNEINRVGQDVMCSCANRMFPLTIMVGTSSQFYCSYVGAIGGSGDFVKAFECAKNHIFETMEWLMKNTEEYEQHFPAKSGGEGEHGVGFVTKKSNQISAKNRVVVKGFLRDHEYGTEEGES